MAEPEHTIDLILELGIKKICPIHCTGETFRDYMKENYPDNFIKGCVGTTLILNEETIDTKRSSFSIFPVIVILVVATSTIRLRKIKRKY